MSCETIHISDALAKRGTRASIDVLRQDFACFRINWDYLVGASEGLPRAVKRLSIWARHDDGRYPRWQRHYEERCALDCRPWYRGQIRDLEGELKKSPELRQNEGIYVEGDTIVFDGGYLEVQDPGLGHLSDTLGLDTPDKVNTLFEYGGPDSACDPFKWEEGVEFEDNYGRSIHLEVTYVHTAPHSHAPLFYFPQDDYQLTATQRIGEAVFLGLLPDAQGQRVTWRISDTLITSVPFALGAAEPATPDEHTLAVTLDSDWRYRFGQHSGPRLPYFELTVDSLGLAPDRNLLDSGRPTNAEERGSETSGKYSFGSGGRSFYIGSLPAYDESGLQNSGWTSDKRFHGRIYRIFFDPTTNCNQC